MGRRYNRYKANKQLDASLKYKKNLRKAGVPLRDDLARAAFIRVLDDLADKLEKGDGEKLEKGINVWIRRLPDRFDKEKAHDRLRKIVAQHRLARLEAKGMTDSDV
ncbi:hypothetical protein HPT29_027735 (plasmid) [Microvirga terrae]|uniref:Uncharacterized protein n=1 Tax=Microvirga terrae TaxID=2740529 RepID=A0ABY5S0K1_9HYPH|nr:hypothetical protein [Microvirga terrae]UVF22813.1 hypothetical protein HPT29_027735 [Microvirga terrae]